MKAIKSFWATYGECISSPVFIGVLIAKMVCGSLFASHYLRDLFIPFIRYFVDSGFSNPWNEFLKRGVLDVFPYSSVMLAVLTLPQILGALIFGSAAQVPWSFELFLMRVPMLLADGLIYLILCRWFETKRRSVLWLYWCSPILFYISYIHGQIDAIPTAFLMLSLWYALRQSPAKSGISLALGAAAKFHLVLAAPLIGFYLLKKHGSRWSRPAFLFSAVFLGAFALLIGPLIASPGYHVLVLKAKEANWVYDLAFTMPHGMKILLCPAALLALILHFFSYREITKDVLILYTGLIYTLLIVLVSPAPGWIYWSMPFLCYFLIRHDVITYVPYLVYNAAYLFYYVCLAPGIAFPSIERYMAAHWPEAHDFCFTVMQASIALVAVWVYRVGVKSYVRYRVRRQSLAVGIGGDSASGKHTLAETLIGVLGVRDTVRLHGDDYHRWPRGHEAWDSQTHLDPRSNYFRQPVEHIHELKSGGTINKPVYDHTRGEFGPLAEMHSKRFILFEGLHPFVFERMRNAFDIKIFLATHEPLRHHWKIQRDMQDRGYAREKVTAEIERRQADSVRYIQPQAAFADWVIEYLPLDPAEEGPSLEPFANGPLKARHRLSSAILHMETLIDHLGNHKASLHLFWSMEADLRRQVFEVSGSLAAADVGPIAYRIFPDLDDYLDSRPVWKADLPGVCQLVFLVLFMHVEDVQ